MTEQRKPTAVESARAGAVEKIVIYDPALLNDAAEIERIAAFDFTLVRQIEGKSPTATALGMIVQAGYLLHCLYKNNPRGRDMYDAAITNLRRVLNEGLRTPPEGKR